MKRPEDLPVWGYVTLGRMFKGLSLVIHKMGLATLVPAGPGVVVVKTEGSNGYKITCPTKLVCLVLMDGNHTVLISPLKSCLVLASYKVNDPVDTS